jgi:hypothetical protein
MSSYKDLIAWQKGMELVASIYDATDGFPSHEHSRGSLAEIETQVLIAQQRKYLNPETAMKLTQKIDELGRILSGLINSLQSKAAQDSGLGTNQ